MIVEIHFMQQLINYFAFVKKFWLVALDQNFKWSASLNYELIILYLLQIY